MNPVGKLTVTGRNLTVAALAAAALLSQPAHAQNLVENPDFSEGNGSFDGYTTNANSFAYIDNMYLAVLDPGDFLTQSIATTPGVTYLTSFVATSFGPGNLTYSNATGCCTLTPFSFSSSPDGSSTDLTFTNDGPASEYVGQLDVEAAPAPIPGAGASSLAIGALGLAGARIMKRRRTFRNAA
jgi:hypothetical protein